MGDIDAIEIKVLRSISDVKAEDWNACAGSNNPFVQHAFLKALEDSGSVEPETGWLPQHLIVEDGNGLVVGCVPMYLKGHSQGEYVFDHGWADAYERTGRSYYPKLLAGVPFTPATGPRLLTRPGPGAKLMRDKLILGMVEATHQLKVSSLHVLFPDEDEWTRMGELGMLKRTAQQFHWLNDGYETFEDYLMSLNSRKRKAVRKERREATQNGIEIEVVTGADLTEAHWDAFWQFYQDTSARKWGRTYLNRDFFSKINETFADNTALVLAKRSGRYIAGALNFIGEDTIFGRNWGCIEDHRFLHFEVCYYAAIEFAINRGLQKVEAGAQGQHKLARGYLPTHTYSAHWIPDQGFREAVERFLEDEREYVDERIDALEDRSPFRNVENDAQANK